MTESSPFIMIADSEDNSSFTIYDMETKEPIVFAGRELAEMELEDANRMTAVLSAIDPALWRSPTAEQAQNLERALALYNELAGRAEGA